MPWPLLLALVVALSGCREPVGPGGWVRVDLWRRAPEVDSSSLPVSTAQPPERRLAPLGSAEVRDLALVPPDQLRTFPHRPAAQVRALSQVAGSRWHWRLRLGGEPFLSFVPLGASGPCQCFYRVAIRAEGAEHEVARVAVAPVSRTAPPAVEVALEAWAGEQIEVIFEVLSEGRPADGQRVLWGSPAVAFREPQARSTPPRDETPNVLLVGLDTLRADALGAWGRQPSLTPTLDRLAAESEVYLAAYSTFNSTNPSFASIFTGRYGKNHGVYDLTTPLPAEQVTLAELFAGAGYDTMAVISASHLGNHNSGLGQGFSEVFQSGEQFSAELAVDLTVDWLASRSSNPHPFFLWLHLFDPHTPHTPPEPYASGLRPATAPGFGPVIQWEPFRPQGPRAFDEQVLGANRDLYDGEVAYLDRQVGRLVEFLSSRGLLESTLLVLVADHGESLGEHGIRYQHVGLHETTTHIPLLLRWPQARRAGLRQLGLVQTIDLFPTLLRAGGLTPPDSDGLDLEELAGRGQRGRRLVFAEHSSGLGTMVRSTTHKYLVSRGNRFLPDGVELFDLAVDPKEERNLAGEGLGIEAEMARLLERWRADQRAYPLPQPRQLDLEELARLRALGYLHEVRGN